MIYTAAYYLDTYLHPGNLPLNTNYGDTSTGFNFEISWGCVYVPGYEYYKNKTANPLYIPAVGTSISPYFGYSPEAKFELTRMIKRTFPDAIRYYLTFEINCELYYGGNYIRGEYFGTLEDGVLETIIELPL